MLRMGSDISSLVLIMNPEEREKFKLFIESLDRPKLDLVLDQQFCNFSTEDILECISSWNEYDTNHKIIDEAVSKGETTIPKDNWPVHVSHCCSNHGCKYGDKDCPVSMGLVGDEGGCEYCYEILESHL